MSFPYEIKRVESELNAHLLQDFTGERNYFVQVGPNKWFLPSKYESQAKGYYNLPLRNNDLWIVTYPRSGTTWTQELLWLLNNNLDYEMAEKVMLGERFPFMEFTLLLDKEVKREVLAMNPNNVALESFMEFWDTPGYKFLSSMDSPRHIKSHLPMSLLPPSLLDTCKVVYVARNPKDVAVSYYHHNRLLTVQGYQGDFPMYWDYFEKNLLIGSPYWQHVLEAWDHRHHPNMLFLFYEELSKDIKGIIRRVANFLGKLVTDVEIDKLADHLHIDNFRRNPSINQSSGSVQGLSRPGEQGFIRNGRVGDNSSYFPPDLKARADKWIEEHLQNTDLKFPS